MFMQLQIHPGAPAEQEQLFSVLLVTEQLHLSGSSSRALLKGASVASGVREERFENMIK